MQIREIPEIPNEVPEFYPDRIPANPDYYEPDPINTPEPEPVKKPEPNDK
jgi:hypothetical protein